MDTQRVLFAFDFDHTILEENSDMVAADLLSRTPDSFSDRVSRMIYTRSGQPYVDPSLPSPQTNYWIECMNPVFRALLEQSLNSQPVLDAPKLLNIIAERPLAPGMDDLLHELLRYSKSNANGKPSLDTIILSDANSLFIDEVLRKRGLLDLFTRIYTNPAHFERDAASGRDYLRGEPLVASAVFPDAPFECALCRRNRLCKGALLAAFLAQCPAPYTHIFYAGDGENDLCPLLALVDALRLGQQSDRSAPASSPTSTRVTAFPRADFALSRLLLAPGSSHAATLAGAGVRLVHWSSAHDILRVLADTLPLSATTISA